MRKCLVMQELHSHRFPSEGTFLQDIIVKHLPTVSGSLLSSMTGDEKILFFHLSSPTLNEVVDFKVTGHEKLLPPIKKFIIDGVMATYLQKT